MQLRFIRHLRDFNLKLKIMVCLHKLTFKSYTRILFFLCVETFHILERYYYFELYLYLPTFILILFLQIPSP